MSRLQWILAGFLALSCLVGSQFRGLEARSVAATTTPVFMHGKFDIQVRVDQGTRTVIVDVADGPSLGIVLIEAVVTSYLANGGTQVQTHMTLLQTDVNGFARYSSALSSNGGVVGSEAVIRALHANTSLTSFFESSHWVMAGTHLSDAHQIATYSDVALDLITGDVKKTIFGLPTLPAPGVVQDAPVSNVFISDDPACVGLAQLSCSGTWFAAGPVGMYQASTGPAGVFTAN